jgi:formylglycine-generating enzyme required for sulfatase activity
MMKRFLNLLSRVLLLACVLQPTTHSAENSRNEKPGKIVENSIGMRLAYIPGGSFTMGSEPDERGRQEEEVQHVVKITRSFWMSITEVTQTQWTAVMGFNRSNHQGSDLPVEKVSWGSVTEFCKKLSLKEGKLYQLPTEAEWEYACRAGSTGAFGGTGQLNDMGWYEDNSGGATHPVAGKKPNAWGLFDMHGNVAEWCGDYYVLEYADGEAVDPTGPKEGRARVVRGGSYSYFAASCRCAARSSLPESYQVPHVGFRVVMEVSP